MTTRVHSFEATRGRRGRGRPSARGWAGLAVVVCLAAPACAHEGPARSTARPRAEPGWIEAPLVGEAAGRGAALEDLGSDPAGRIARLDRLLDLFDAARFAEDEDARETLWDALGGHGTGIGQEATREAVARLLDEALALETAAAEDPAALSEDGRRFLTDAIMLLSADLQHPARAEDLSIRNLAFRELVQRGHPRVRDNARWRLYDHARGTLRGATEAPPPARLDVAVQALYAERDEVVAWLRETAPHAAPPAPGADDLFALVEEPKRALRTLDRWAPVVARRDAEDRALLETLRATLPAPRDPEWPVPEVPRGTARPESGGPVVRLEEHRAVIDAGRPQARTVPLSDDPSALAQALQSTLAQDGRGTVLLVVDPLAPAPDLFTLLRGIRRAQASTLELAVREPRLEGDGDVVLALPLHVVRSADRTAGAAALLEARVAVHLTGRGPLFVIDGQGPLVPEDRPGALEALARRVARAYPRERIVRLTVSDDVAYPQLLDTVAALSRGPDPAFPAVGWWAGGSPPAEVERDASTTLARRLSWVLERPAVQQTPSVPLAAEDTARLEAYARRLLACLPELEAPVRVRARARVRLRVAGGRVSAAEVVAPSRVTSAARAAFEACARDEALGLGLGYRDGPLSIELELGELDGDAR